MSSIQKKMAQRLVAIFGLLALLVSCRGIPLTKLNSFSVSRGVRHPICCDTFGEKNQTVTNIELAAVLTPQKNLLGPILFFSALLFNKQRYLVRFFSKYKSYIRAIRDRYGSFIVLNYFIDLFNRGLLHAKIF